MENAPFQVDQCGIKSAVADGVTGGGVLALRVNALVYTSGGNSGGQVQQSGGVVHAPDVPLFKVPFEGFKVLAGFRGGGGGGGVGGVCHVLSFLS